MGLLADELGRRTRLPRVTLLVLFGLIAGPAVLDLLPREFQSWYDFLATISLTMVAFLLGGRLSIAVLKRNGRSILSVSFWVVLSTAAIVGSGLLLAGVALPLALVLAGMATATDPAAIQDVARQNNADGPVTATLLGVVAVDDAWGLIAFALLLAIARAGAGDGSADVLLHGLWEVGGAIALGGILGVPAAYLTGRLRSGEPTQMEALGLVLLCAGIAVWLQVSFLLSGMIAGAIIANLAQHHSRPFHEIEQIEWPFMVLFFVLAGTTLQFDSVRNIGLIVVAYIVLRIGSRVAGSCIGGVSAGLASGRSAEIGIALLPQAGVALGMALVASTHFPELREQLMAIAIATTLFFELVGPFLTQRVLMRAGEIGQGAELE